MFSKGYTGSENIYVAIYLNYLASSLMN